MTEVFETEYWCDTGHFNEDQALQYRKLCNQLKPTYALEIGFCTGRSASCLLYYAKNSLRKLISVDKNLDWKKSGRMMARTLESSFPNFRVYEAESQVLLTDSFMRSVFPGGLDFATVDGDHSYAGCLQDLNSIAPFLNNQGILVVDDYYSGPPNGVAFPSVNAAVDAFLKDNKAALAATTWNSLGKGFCIIRRK